jgi:hypothetical protein
MTPVKRAPRFDIREASGMILLVFAALLVANVVFTIFAARPRVARYRQLTDTSSPQALLVKTREGEVRQKEEHRAALEKARDEMKRLAVDVLSTRDRRMISVQLEVMDLVKELGISSDRVQYEAPEEGPLERFGIVVPLAGGYQSLRKFIQKLEASDNFLVVERVQLGTGKVADLVELDITLATYFIAANAKLDDLGKKPIAPPRES